MRLLLATVVALSLAACSKADSTKATPATEGGSAAVAPVAADASATAPQADSSAGGNEAIKAPHPENAGPPAAGSNSFTEGQAKGHIENSGYANVSGLSKDANGVWHAKATKGGQSYSVSLDFKGNVVTN